MKCRGDPCGRPGWGGGIIVLSALPRHYPDLAAPPPVFDATCLSNASCYLLESVTSAIRHQYFEMVATGLISNTIVDIHDAHLIVRDRLFVRTAELQRNPDLVLFAVHLLFNCIQLLDIVAQYTWLVSTHLHLTAHNDH